MTLLEKNLSVIENTMLSPSGSRKLQVRIKDGSRKDFRLEETCQNQGVGN